MICSCVFSPHAGFVREVSKNCERNCYNIGDEIVLFINFVGTGLIYDTCFEKNIGDGGYNILIQLALYLSK